MLPKGQIGKSLAIRIERGRRRAEGIIDIVRSMHMIGTESGTGIETGDGLGVGADHRIDKDVNGGIDMILTLLVAVRRVAASRTEPGEAAESIAMKKKTAIMREGDAGGRKEKDEMRRVKKEPIGVKERRKRSIQERVRGAEKEVLLWTTANMVSSTKQTLLLDLHLNFGNGLLKSDTSIQRLYQEQSRRKKWLLSLKTIIQQLCLVTSIII